MPNENNDLKNIDLDALTFDFLILDNHPVNGMVHLPGELVPRKIIGGKLLPDISEITGSSAPTMRRIIPTRIIRRTTTALRQFGKADTWGSITETRS